MELDLITRLNRIERQLRFYKIGFILALVLVLVLILAESAIGTPGSNESNAGIIHARGLIIEDAAGKPRIVMGAPITKLPGRKRQDDLTGIVYLDESGIDRLTLGKYPDPMTPEGIKPRRVGGAGILIYDKDGIERGGYGVLDDQTALLTLDWPKTGEAAVMSSGKTFSGIGLFYRSDIGVYRDAITLGAESEGDKSLIKVTDAKGTPRITLKTSGTNAPVLKRYDKDGHETNGKF